MIVYKCSCDWIFVINRKRTKVVGPFFTNSDKQDPIHIGNNGNVLSYDEWADHYGDCEFRFTKTHKEEKNATHKSTT